MTHRAVTALMLVVCILVTSATAGAQQPPPAPRPVPTAQPPQAAAPALQDSQDARETRERFHRLLRQYRSPRVEELAGDPSLLDRPDYLGPYPGLTAFLERHPEIARNPSYFFAGFAFDEVRYRTPEERAIGMLEEILSGLSVGAVTAAFLGVFVWLVRTIVDYRRWLRQSRIQVEVHTKLLDRLTAHEDLLAYMQSPAGSRFLQSAPIAVDDGPRPGGAPLSRMVWSFQAGVVLIALGVGLWLVQWGAVPEVAQGFRVMGILAVALGVGFAVSAVVSYKISERFGLLSVQKSS